MLEDRHLDSILLTRLRYLGDVVMATPLLEVLRRGDPEVRLGFLAEKAHGQVLRQHPYLDELHLLDTQRRGSDAKARTTEPADQNLPALTSWEMLSQLKSFQYDLAVDLFFNPRSAWLLRLSGIPQRISGTQGSRRFLYTHNIIPALESDKFHGLFDLVTGGMGEHLARLAPLVHEESGLSFPQWFCREYGKTGLGPNLPRQYWADKDLGNLSELSSFVADQPVVMAPGATWSSKEWPMEHWKEFIQGLLAQTDRPLLIIQPPGAGANWKELGRDIPVERGGVLPVLSLPEVLNIIARSILLVSVDGGVMHTGVGLGVPTVGLFGPTDPNLWFPYTNAGPFRVLTSGAHCAPCDLHECDEFICLPDLMPQQVLKQCLELIKISE